MTGETRKIGRLSIYSDAVGTWIEVASTRNGPGLVFLGLWLFGLSFAGYLSLSLMIAPMEAPVFVQLTLSIWGAILTLGWLATLLSMIWMVLGREVLILRDDTVTKRLVLPFIARSWHYPAGQIRELRRVEDRPQPEVPQHAEQHEGLGLPVGAYGAIAFDCDGRTVHFGAALKPPAAAALLEAVETWFERRQDAA